MEDKLFKFNGLQGDVVEMQYYDVSLNQQLGGFPKGYNCQLAVINFEDAQLSLYEPLGPISEYVNKNKHNMKLVGRFSLELNVAKDLLNDE